MAWRKILREMVFVVLSMLGIVFPSQIFAASSILNDPSLASAIPESLATGSMSGGFSYTYPLTLPPGRDALEPDLALTYNSQATNGASAVGYGWTLAVPWIERVNRQGLEDLYTGTFFYSSFSSQDLVPVSLTDAQHGTYADRVDDGRLLSYTFDAATQTWTVIDKLGQTYVFGRSSASRLDDAHTGTGSKIFRWMLEEVRDTHNNVIRYAYQKDQGQIYLSSINYTGHADERGVFDVLFEYEPRADVTTLFETGFSIRTTQRLRTISVRSQEVLRREYALRYTNGDNDTRSLLAGVTESAYAQDNVRTMLPETTFTYASSTPTWTQANAYTVPVDIIDDNGWSAVDGGVRFADINGDGRIDLLHDDQLVSDEAYLHNESGWTRDPNWNFPMSYMEGGWPVEDSFVGIGAIDHGVRLADVNGDGYVDVLYGNAFYGAAKIYLNNADGTGWTQNNAWQLPYFFVEHGGTAFQDTGLRLMEVNGDGLIDLVLASYGERRVYLNNGEQGGWTRVMGYDLPVPFIMQSLHDNGVREGDVNGDGLDDLLFANGWNERAVYLNAGNGTGWVLDRGFRLPVDFVRNDGVSVSDTGTRIVDVNGDGLPDLVYAVWGQPDIVYINNGNGTGWTADPSYVWPVDLQGQGGYHNGAVPIDVNADGLVDVVYAKSTDQRYVTIHNGSVPDVLTRVHESHGTTMTIGYTTAGAAENSTLPFPVQVVASVTVDNGTAPVATTTYAYHDGAYYFASPTDRRFAGFGRVTTTNPLGESTTTYLHQGNTVDAAHGERADSYARMGKPYREELYDRVGTLVKTTMTRWGQDDLGSGRMFVHRDEVVEQTFTNNGTHTDIASRFVYDSANGNLLTQTEFGEVTSGNDAEFVDVGIDSRSTMYTYAVDPTNRLVGFPSSATVRGNDGGMSSQKRYLYDGLPFGSVAVGDVTQEQVWIQGAQYATSSSVYDVYGNVVTQTDPLGHSTTFAYDETHLTPTRITNALGHEKQMTYDLAFGKQTRAIEPNGSITETQYDGFGRPLREQRSSAELSNVLETTQTWMYDDVSFPRSVTHRVYGSADVYQETITYLDGDDHVIETKSLDENAIGYFESETTYDALGRVASTTLPEASGNGVYDRATVSPVLSESYDYDTLGRVITSTNALGSTQTRFTGFLKTVTDPLGNAKAYRTDGLNRLVEVTEYLDAIPQRTNYTWDASDRLLALTDAAGNLRRFSYDGRGLRLTAEDLHAPADLTFGVWSYVYDLAGNLSSSTSPNGIVMRYTYDGLNRQITEDASDAPGVESITTYDACMNGVGSVCSVVVQAGTTTQYIYNARGQKASESITIEGVEYPTQFAYDRQGKIVLTTHPDGTRITNTYNAMGLLETVQKQSPTDIAPVGVVSNFDYGPYGQVVTEASSNGTTTTYTYDANARYRLVRKVTTGWTTPVEQNPATTTTTTRFFPTSADGYVYAGHATWDGVHDATIGSQISTNIVIRTGSGKAPTSYYMYRAFFPFDTSAIPDDATITAAQLGVYVTSKRNDDNDGDDFVTVVQTSQPNPFALANEDFDLAGTVNAPTEGIDRADRKDITNIALGAYTTLPLNATGMSWISKIGVTKLGLREGHDVLDSAFTSLSGLYSYYNSLNMRGSEYADTTSDPYLEVTYTQTAAAPEQDRQMVTIQDLAYTYDAIGNILQITDTSQTDTAKTTTYAYDDLSRLTSATESGAVNNNNQTITYAYDVLGNLTYRSDAGTYHYDGNQGDSYANPHAVTSIQSPVGSTTTFTYDRNGNVLNDGTTTYTWDARNRLTSSSRSIAGEPVTTTTTTTFSSMAGDGYIQKLHASWDVAHDAITGSSTYPLNTTTRVGEGKTSLNSYLYRSFFPFDTSTIPDDATITSAALNVFVSGKSDSDNDGMDFVTLVQGMQASTATLTNADFDQAGSINNPIEGIAVAQRKDITQVGTNAYLTFNLNSTGLNWISKINATKLALRGGHDVLDSSLVVTAPATTAYNYLTIRTSEYAATNFDPFLSVTYTQLAAGNTVETTTYTYDHTTRRVSKRFAAETTIYPSSEYSVGAESTTVYIQGPTGLIASIETTAGTSIAKTIHTDHLGSTNVVTNENGTMIELLDYHPYGTERISWSSASANGKAQSKKTYIGEYSDEESGLSYLNARYYDPKRGQFLSEDPVYLLMAEGKDKRAQSALSDPQSQNSYGYGRSNPVNFTDSNGEYAVPAFIAGAVVFWNSVVDPILTAYSTYQATVNPTQENITNAGIDVGLSASPLPAGVGFFGSLVNKTEKSVDAVKAADATHSVYQSVKNGVVQYIGRTNDFMRRSSEHLRTKGMQIQPIKGLNSLTKDQARGVEQQLIEYYGLGKNGGILLNQRNGISTKNSDYQNLTQVGKEILHDKGLK